MPDLPEWPHRDLEQELMYSEVTADQGNMVRQETRKAVTSTGPKDLLEYLNTKMALLVLCPKPTPNPCRIIYVTLSASNRNTLAQETTKNVMLQLNI